MNVSDSESNSSRELLPEDFLEAIAERLAKKKNGLLKIDTALQAEVQEPFVNSSLRKEHRLKRAKSFSFLDPPSLIPEEYENTQQIQSLIPTVREGTLTIIPELSEHKATSSGGRSEWFAKKPLNRARIAKFENSAQHATNLRGAKVNPCRRKSDCCYSHGGVSDFELRTANITIDCPRKVELDELENINQSLTLRNNSSNGRSTRFTARATLIDSNRSTRLGLLTKSITLEYSDQLNGYHEGFDQINLRRSHGITANNKPSFEQSESRKTFKDDLSSYRSRPDSRASPIKLSSNCFNAKTISNELQKKLQSPKVNSRNASVCVRHNYTLSQDIVKHNKKSEMLLEKLKNLTNQYQTSQPTAENPSNQKPQSAFSFYQISPKASFDTQNITHSHIEYPSRPESKQKPVHSKNFLIKQTYSNSSLMPRLQTAKEQTRTRIRAHKKKESHLTQKSESNQLVVSTTNQLVMHPIYEKSKKLRTQQAKLSKKHLIFQSYSSPSPTLEFADSYSHLRPISVLSDLTTKGKHSFENNMTSTLSLASRQSKEKRNFFS